MRSNSNAYALCACARDREEKLESSTRIVIAERPVGFAWEREIYIGVRLNLIGCLGFAIFAFWLVDA